MSCPHCSGTRNHSTTLQKEVKYWKERYFIEKKSLSCLVQWILGVFGFAVKVEVDKESLGLRIEGRENKDAMSQAVFPPTMTDNKITLLMEDRMVAEDFLEDPEEMAGLELALTLASADEVDGDVEVDPAQFQGHDGTIEIQETKCILPTESVVGQDQQQLMEETNNQNQHDTQVILDILRNYGDPTGQQQPSYIILKDGDSAIPVQLDCSQFLNGEFTTTITTPTSSGGGKDATIMLPDNQQIVYRLAPSPMIEDTANTAEIPSPLPDRTTLSAPKTYKRKSQKPQSQRYSPPAKKTKGGQVQPPSDVANVAPQSVGSSMTVKSDGIKIGGLEKGVVGGGADFGLTLREKAQVYVQNKAMEVIKRTGQSSFTCVECDFGYTFTSVENALTHTKTHFEGKPYKCLFCDETFAIQKQYLNHRKSHYPSKKSSSPASATTKQPVFLSPRANTPSVIPSNRISEPVGMKPPSKDLLSNKQQQQNFGQPGPGNRNKQFKCKVPKCEWSYVNAHELEWHMKAHSQCRV